MRRRRGRPQANPCTYIDPIQPGKALDLELSRFLWAECGPMEKGYCWRNSVLSLYFLATEDEPEDTYQPNIKWHQSLTYVEGWLLLQPENYPIEHGWLEIDGEAIVDVTLLDESAPHYYGVLRYTLDQCRQIMKHRRTLPFFENDEKATERMIAAVDSLPIDPLQTLSWAYTVLVNKGTHSLLLDANLSDRIFSSPLLQGELPNATQDDASVCFDGRAG